MAALREHPQKPGVFITRPWLNELRHPLQRRARVLVALAIQSGLLVRQPCELCGTVERIHAHHDDYDQPLAVRWLCARCHAGIHPAADIGRLGGYARAAALTKKQRVAIASKAGQARWAKWRKALANEGKGD